LGPQGVQAAGGAPNWPRGQPAQPEPSRASERGGGQAMGAQSASNRGMGFVGCFPNPHLNALHEVREAAPGVSVLPLSGQGRHAATEVLPSSAEKLFWGQGRHCEPAAGWYVPAGCLVRACLCLDGGVMKESAL